MRKKFLALLMCATMVLGTAVTASAATTPSATDLANAATILAQYEKNIKAEIDSVSGKTSAANFTTVYTPDNATAVQFTYAATVGSYVKVDPSATGKKLTATSGTGYDLANASTSAADYNTITVTKENKSVDAVDFEDRSVIYFNGNANGLAYATVVNKTYVPGTALKLDADEYLLIDGTTSSSRTLAAASQSGIVKVAKGTANPSPVAVTEIVTGDYRKDAADTTTVPTFTVKVVKLTFFTKAETGKIVAAPTGYTTVNKYGIDKDGYIALQAGDASKFYSALTSGYYMTIGAASTDTLTSVASALADGTITKDAAAVELNFYELVAANPYVNGYEQGFYTLQNVNAKLTDATVTFATDWLSRTSAKNANAVFIVDKNVTSVIPYVSAINATYKVSDYADGKFTTNYLASGTYVFDTVADASNNDGAAAENTTTTAAASTGSSPKTGDVAPIAALAVVMMGAFGALVVASKKRA